MTKFDKHMWVHVSYANVIEYVKKLIEKDVGTDVGYSTVTFVMAKSTIIDGRKLLIVLPPKSQLKYSLKKKHAVQNLFI